jgi:beta-lactamase regulating signal transducer with metallopeptidase domain
MLTTLAALDPSATVATLDAAGRWLLPVFTDYAVRGTLVLVGAWAATRILRRSAASVRHGVWVAAMTWVAAMPLLVRTAPTVAVRIPPFGSIAVSRLQHSGPMWGAPPVVVTRQGAASGSVVAAAAREPLGLQTSTGIALVWITGALLLLGRFLVGTVVVWRRAFRAAAVTDPTWVLLVQTLARELGIRRPITLLTAPTHAVPVTWGIVYPVVLLPTEALQWPPACRRTVVLHELAHVARVDAATQLLGQLTLAVNWFNPLAWVAVARMRTEREQACDDVVLTCGSRASAYATDLLTLVRTLQPSGEPAFASLAMARRSEIEGRLLAILDPRRRRARLNRRGRLLSLAAALPLAVAVAAVRPSPVTAALATPAADTARPAATGFDKDRTTLPTAKTSVPEQPERRSVVVTPARGPTRCAVQTEFVRGGVSADPAEIGALEAEKDDRAILAIAANGRCTTVRLDGHVSLSDDATEILTIPSGGSAIVTEQRGGHTRRAEIRPSGDTLVHRYSAEGEVRPWAEGRAWYEATLAELIRETAYDARDRVARLRALGGVAGVLVEVRRMRSTNAPRAYFEALLDTGPLSSDERQRAADLAQSILSGSRDRDRIVAQLRGVAIGQ